MCIQFILQQCCKTSCTFLLPVLPYLHFRLTCFHSLPSVWEPGTGFRAMSWAPCHVKYRVILTYKFSYKSCPTTRLHFLIVQGSVAFLVNCLNLLLLKHPLKTAENSLFFILGEWSRNSPASCEWYSRSRFRWCLFYCIGWWIRGWLGKLTLLLPIEVKVKHSQKLSIFWFCKILQFKWYYPIVRLKRISPSGEKVWVKNHRSMACSMNEIGNLLLYTSQRGRRARQMFHARQW